MVGKLLGVVVMALGLGLAGCGGGSDEEQAAAREALSKWKAKQPAAYTFLVTPGGAYGRSEALIRVEDDHVVSVMGPAGSRPSGYDDYTMTKVLEEAVTTSQERDRFVGAYDPDLGYLLWFEVPTDVPVGDGSPTYGLSIRCFEPRTDSAACASFL